MRDKNLAMSDLLSTFVLRKIPTLCLLLCVWSSSEGFAQRSESVFNTVGYKAHRPRVYSVSPTKEEKVVEDVGMEENDTLKISSDTIKSRISNVSFPLKNIWITSPFGVRKDPMNRKRRKMHNGLDLRARYEPVYSMLPGVVTAVSSSMNGGRYVTLNHGGFVCSYLHLSKVLVKRGDRIKAGQAVAISGNSGKRTTGPHLHITCRWGNEKGKFFNPLLLLTLVAEEMSHKIKT